MEGICSDAGGEQLGLDIPLYFTHVKGITEVCNSKDTVITLEGLLSDQDRPLLYSIHFNYMVDVSWLMSMYPAESRKKAVTIFVDPHYFPTPSEENSYKNVEFVKVNVPMVYGTHHSKMMLLFYEDSCRIVIHTANMVPFDWDRMTQMAWVSPLLCLKCSGAKGTDSAFQEDLVSYLRSYKADKARSLATKLLEYDMTGVKARLVFSVPGYHAAQNIHKYGHMRVRKILEKHKCPDDWIVAGHFSSIGSLGKNDCWLAEEWALSLCGGSKVPSRDQIYLSYPTVANIVKSLKGVESGFAFPYSSNTHLKQMYLKNYLCEWNSDDNGRTHAAPHVKAYLRADQNGDKVAWFILTSANLSKAAWGVLQKNKSQLCIRSYELGVIFLASDFGVKWLKAKTCMNRRDGTPGGSVHCLIPFNLPPKRYSESADPWTC